MSSAQQIFEDNWEKAGAEVTNFVGHGVLLNENMKVLLLHRSLVLFHVTAQIGTDFLLHAKCLEIMCSIYKQNWKSELFGVARKLLNADIV